MFLSLLQKRRSIRRFQEKQVEPQKVEFLIEAALRSPSSRGLSPWEFVVVQERELLEKLANAKQHGSSFLKDAPLAIVVCASPDRSDVWIEDASIASAFVMLAAESLGLGACWIQIRQRMHNEEESAERHVIRTLNAPESLCVESIIAIGYPDEQPAHHQRNELRYGKVFFNRYGEVYKKRK